MLIRGIDPATTLSVHKFREINELNKYIIYIFKKTYTLFYMHIHKSRNYYEHTTLFQLLKDVCTTLTMPY